MYLVMRNPALLHANYKGADQPAHRQFYPEFSLGL